MTLSPKWRRTSPMSPITLATWAIGYNEISIKGNFVLKNVDDELIASEKQSYYLLHKVGGGGGIRTNRIQVYPPASGVELESILYILWEPDY